MISAYPQYKVSSIKWIDELPHDWEELNAQYLLEKKIGNNVGENWRTTQLLSLTQKGVIKKDINDGKGKTHSDYSTYQTVEKGDLVFCLFDMDETPRTVGLSSHFGMITSAYSVFVPKKGNDGRYLYYFYEFVDNCKGLRPYYTGLRKTVRPPEFLKILIPKPPLEHQQYIANFLDRETARIDKLIAEKQTFIKLLKEKRQALISHVVTKGLNPNVKMKDSGIEWIGEVPADWLVTRLKFLVSNIIDTEHKTIPFVDNSDFYVARTSDIKDAELILTNCKRTDVDSFSEWTRRGVPASGDMILTREAPAGEACIVPNDYNICLGQRTVLIKFNNKLLAEYFLLVIYSDVTKEFIENASMGSTVKHLNMSDIPNIPVFCPDIETQKLIVDEAGKEISKLKLLEKLTVESIDLLKEHRTALISATVTGKIDVRNQ